MEIKKCITCSNDIFKNAVKCTHCNSFQNWKRHLNFSNTVLALLIALFSVIGIVVPQIKKNLEQQTSNVIAKNYIITEYGLSLICLNSGNKSGFISNCKIEIQDLRKKKWLWDFNLDLTIPSTTRVVEKESLDEKFYSIKAQYFKKKIEQYSYLFDKGINDDNYVFFVKVIVGQFQGEETTLTLGPSKIKDLYWNLQ